MIRLTNEEREELKRWSNSRTLPAGDVFKARLILALADGVSYSRIEAELKTSRPTIARWRARFEEGRIAGLEGRHIGSRPIWTLRSMRLCSAWMRKPLFKRSIGSILCCLCHRDAPSATVLNITDMARSRSTPRWMCKREKCGARPRSDEFVAFLEQVVASAPAAEEVHIVLDNLSAHKTKTVAELLERNPRVRLHFTPTYSSWLNQVEIWFARIERDVIARGVFTSVRDLSRKLMKYIRAYAKSARPFRWT